MTFCSDDEQLDIELARERNDIPHCMPNQDVRMKF